MVISFYILFIWVLSFHFKLFEYHFRHLVFIFGRKARTQNPIMHSMSLICHLHTQSMSQVILDDFYGLVSGLPLPFIYNLITFKRCCYVLTSSVLVLTLNFEHGISDWCSSSNSGSSSSRNIYSIKYPSFFWLENTKIRESEWNFTSKLYKKTSTQLDSDVQYWFICPITWLYIVDTFIH